METNLKRQEIIKLLPAFATIIFWIGGHLLSLFFSDYMKTPSIKASYFYIPIIFQIFSIILSLKKKIFLKPIYFMVTHMTYGAIIVFLAIPSSWNSIGFLFGFVIGSSLGLTLLNFKEYIFNQFNYLIVGFITFYIKDGHVGNDEILSLPVLLGSIIFFPFVSYYFNWIKDRLKKKTLELDESHNKIKKEKESRDQLLENIDQGYLVFDKEGNIQEGATKISEKHFQQSIESQDNKTLKIWDLLKLNKDKEDIFKKWINKVCEGNIAFKDLLGFAPVRFEESKKNYIKLDFKPIYKDKNIEKIILMASDITREKDLESKVYKNEQRAEFIYLVLESPQEFISVIDDTQEIIALCPSYKETDDGKEEIFRAFHTLKARYSQFALTDVVRKINHIEELIHHNDWGQFSQYLDVFSKFFQQFIKENSFIIKTSNKLMLDSGLGINSNKFYQVLRNFQNVEEVRSYIYQNFIIKDLKEYFYTFKEILLQLAEKEEKSIEYFVEGDTIMVNPEKYDGFLKSAIHIFRNIIDHGIEKTVKRLEIKKPSHGTVKVIFKKFNYYFEISIEDNGKGIDIEQVKAVSIRKRLKDEKEILKMTDHELMQLIFLPRFSTKDRSTNLSGRGIGMDSIKKEIRALGGSVEIKSIKNKGTILKIKLPIIKDEL